MQESDTKLVRGKNHELWGSTQVDTNGLNCKSQLVVDLSYWQRIYNSYSASEWLFGNWLVGDEHLSIPK